MLLDDDRLHNAHHAVVGETASRERLAGDGYAQDLGSHAHVLHQERTRHEICLVGI